MEWPKEWVKTVRPICASMWASSRVAGRVLIGDGVPSEGAERTAGALETVIADN